MTQEPAITATETTPMITVAAALMAGLTPSRAREKMTSGMVVAPGPDRKAERTTSSSDRVKVSRKAETSAW